jgi:tripartite-type tricarboxylate transporter receptor subunit TctC
MCSAGKVAITDDSNGIGATQTRPMTEERAWCSRNATRISFCAIVGMLFATFFTFNVVVARAESWPDRPIVLIVPYGPGNITEFVSRTLQKHFSSRLNATLAIENRHGASGTIGLGAVARAKPDGYTFGLASPDLATVHVTKKELPFEFGIGKTLAPVTQLIG